VFLFLENLRQLVKDEWANGTFTSSDIYGTLQLNSEAIGKARLLEDLLEMNYEWVTEELSDVRE
jgi:hypothetical protein